MSQLNTTFKYNNLVCLRFLNKYLANQKCESSSVKTKTASSVYKVMNIFDRKTKKSQKDHSARRDDYHLFEYIKEEVGWRTADRVFDIKRTFTNAVELGASRGYVSRHLTPDNVSKITLCDTSKFHLDNAIVGDGVEVNKIVMDEENIDLPDNSVDLLVSSLSLHWVNDLPGCFDKIMKCLKPDGVFLASIFGGDTLMELRQSIQMAETERLGGMHQHVSPFTRIRDIGGLLNAAGFTMQTVDTDNMCIWYPSVWHLMEDLRGIGESNAVTNRPLYLSRDVQFAAAAIYEEMYGKTIPHKDTRGIPATYQLINFIGWKPDASQPKPLDRGTGQVSFKDLHRLEEIAKEVKKIDLTEEDMK